MNKASLLIVDDEACNLQLLSQILVSRGYQVRAATSGERALGISQSHSLGLILLDIKMPGMDGYMVCQQLKANPQTCDIPVIFISALEAVEDKVKAFVVGGADYVTKPFQAEEVLARVQTHLAMRSLQRELQEANAQLAAQVEELQARNAELDAFAHTVAHDLKGPASNLIGFTTVLERDLGNLPPEEEREYLRRANNGARKITEIIEALLLLAGVRRADDLQVGPLDMAAIAGQAVRRVKALAEEHQAEIVLPATWPVALGYAPWIEEVWINYISNAIKYSSKPPRVELGWDVERQKDEGERMKDESDTDGSSQALSLISHSSPFIRFWVRDNGSGLTAEQQARLFTPFTRLHKGRTDGHGLGLSIVQRIVEKLGGQVGAESKPGHGSVFWFTLTEA